MDEDDLVLIPRWALGEIYYMAASDMMRVPTRSPARAEEINKAFTAAANAVLSDPSATMDDVRKLLTRIAMWAEHFPRYEKYGKRPTSGKICQAATTGLPDAEFTVEDVHEARALLAKLGRG